jgi:hypothetical protein
MLFQINVNLRMNRHELDIVWEGVTPFLCLVNSKVNLRMRTTCIRNLLEEANVNVRMRTIVLYIISEDATPSSCSLNS